MMNSIVQKDGLSQRECDATFGGDMLDFRRTTIPTNM